MDTEAETRQNTRDISALTTTVTELATMFKYSEKAKDDERADVKQAVSELKTLNEKIGAMGNMQKEVSDLASEVRTLRHDIRNIDHALQGMSMLKKEIEQNAKDIVELRTQQTGIKEWKDKHDGAVSAVRTGTDWTWRIFGPGVQAIFVAGLSWYFMVYVPQQQQSYMKSTAFIEKGGG